MKTPDATPLPKPRDQAPPAPTAGLEELNFFHGAFSRAGERHEKSNLPNQDAFLSMPERGIFGVFDGVGGHSAGEVASQKARDFFREAAQTIPRGLSLEAKQEKWRGSYRQAHAFLKEATGENKEWRGMATTATFADIEKVNEGNWQALIPYTGDTRACVLRGEGTLLQLSIDDTEVMKHFRDEKKWSEDELKDLQSRAMNDNLSEEEKTLLNANVGSFIKSGLGGNTSLTGEPKFCTTNLRKEDILLIGTDGFFRGVTEDLIRDVIKATEGNLELAAKLLVQRARVSGRTQDDVTVVLAKPCSLEK